MSIELLDFHPTNMGRFPIGTVLNHGDIPVNRRDIPYSS